MADKDMIEILGLFFIVIVALALTPTIVSNTTGAQYGNIVTKSYTVVVSTSNTTTLISGGSAIYAPILNDSNVRPVAISSNQTDTGVVTALTMNTDFTVSALGSSSAAGTITFSTLTATKTYNETITWSYPIDTASYTLYGLVPLFWVIAVIAATVVVVTKKLHVW